MVSPVCLTFDQSIVPSPYGSPVGAVNGLARRC
jgi:hypothetical protein